MARKPNKTRPKPRTGGSIGPRKVAFALLALGALAACSRRETATEPRDLVSLSQQLSAATSRIFDFEGTIGGSGADWTAVSGTVVGSSTEHVTGTHSLSLKYPASAKSARLSNLGAVGSAATIYVKAPTSLAGQTWSGKSRLRSTRPKPASIRSLRERWHSRTRSERSSNTRFPCRPLSRRLFPPARRTTISRSQSASTRPIPRALSSSIPCG